MNKSIEELREELELMLISDQYSPEEILKVSEKLDKLIVDYYKLKKSS